MGLYGKIGWLRRPGRRERETALACLDQVGMADFAHRQISQLSGGQQQRVFLARALAQDAKVYFLDEPFAGVDATTERATIELLRQLRNAGKTWWWCITTWKALRPTSIISCCSTCD